MDVKEYIKTKIASEMNKFGLRDVIHMLAGKSF